MHRILVCIDKEECIEIPRYPTEPELAEGGPGSGLPPPYLVATGQAGHAVVGIDIGTRFSRIATFENGRITHLLAAPLPSMAYRLPSGHLTIGMPPSSEAIHVIQDFRNLVGSDWYVEAEGGFYSAEMLTELLIQGVSQLAYRQLERPISKAVLTTPVTYTSSQRKHLIAAAQAVGIDVLQLINEPTAAAFAHCFENPEFEGNILVYHLGAGSFAGSLMEFHNGILEVKSTIGNDSLCANSFTGQLVGWMVDRFNEDSGFSAEKTPSTILRMMSAAEQAIADIHTSGQANIRVTNIDVQKDGLRGLGSKTHGYLLTNITSKEYFSLIEPVIVEQLQVLVRVLEESGTACGGVDRILVDGDTRNLLQFWNKLYEQFPGATIFSSGSIYSAVNGAALQAALLSHSIKDFIVWDIITEPVWVEQSGELKQVISRGTPLPVTSYHKCESPDATVNMHVMQGSENLPSIASLAEITINNCPPTTQGETKVEVHFIANANGVIDYRARHIGLEAQLPIRVVDGQSVSSGHGWSSMKEDKRFDEARLNRLSRIMNMPPLTVLNVLRSKGYTIDHIKNGRAIEDMLKKLRDSRGLKESEAS